MSINVLRAMWLDSCLCLSLFSLFFFIGLAVSARCQLKETRSMLSNTLVTNEVKDNAGASISFQRLIQEGRTCEYGKIAETLYLPYRLKISHQESGKGTSKRRRSVIRFDKNVSAGVAPGETMALSCYIVLDLPVGNMLSQTEGVNVLANVLSFCATTGAGTTVLFDGTGTGAAVLLSGGM